MFIGGNVWCWVFLVAMCVVGSFRWQSEFLCLLGGNVCCMFIGGNVLCRVY